MKPFTETLVSMNKNCKKKKKYKPRCEVWRMHVYTYRDNENCLQPKQNSNTKRTFACLHSVIELDGSSLQ